MIDISLNKTKRYRVLRVLDKVGCIKKVMDRSAKMFSGYKLGFRGSGYKFYTYQDLMRVCYLNGLKEGTHV